MSLCAPITDKCQKKRFVGVMTAVVGVLYLASIGLGIAYASLSNNIVYTSSVWMYVLEIGLQILDLAIYSVAFSFLVFAVFRYGFRASLSFMISYASLTAGRRVVSLLLELLLSGAIGSDDVTSVIIYFVLDILTYAIVVAITAYEHKRYQKYLRKWQKIQRDLGKNDEPTALCPFEKLFSRNNPLQVCALKIGILLSAAKIITRVIFDLYIGAPSGISDLLVMIIYYLSDLLIGVLVYAAMFWFFGLLSKKHLEESMI